MADAAADRTSRRTQLAGRRPGERRSTALGRHAAGRVFLKEFVPEGVQWAHIDIAGPAFNTGGAWGYNPKGGTGVPVRTILAVLGTSPPTDDRVPPVTNATDSRTAPAGGRPVSKLLGR